MSRTKNYLLFTFGIASALGFSWLAQKRHKEISDLFIWQKTLTITRHTRLDAATSSVIFNIAI